MGIRSLFLKKSGALMASTILASTLALTAAPREAAAMDPGTIAATISIINTLKNMSATGGSGMAQRFEALDVKLDVALKNQENILFAIKEVQASIDNLEKNLEGEFKKSVYGALLIASDSHYNLIKTLAEDGTPPTDDKSDYIDFLKALRVLSSEANSTFEKVTTDVKGFEAILMAAPTLYYLAEATYLMAAIEQNAPLDERWQGERPNRYHHTVKFLKKGLKTLSTTRWQEAFNELQKSEQTAKNAITQSPWEQAFAQMLQHKGPGNLKLDICFRSAARAKSVEEWVSTGRIRNMHMAPEFWIEERYKEKTDFKVTDIKRFSLSYTLTKLSPATNAVNIAVDTRLSPVKTWKSGYSVDGWNQAVKRQSPYKSAASNAPPGGLDTCVIGPVSNDELISSFNKMKKYLAIYSQQQVYLAALHETKEGLKDLSNALEALEKGLDQHANPVQQPQPVAPPPTPGG